MWLLKQKVIKRGNKEPHHINKQSSKLTLRGPHLLIVLYSLDYISLELIKSMQLLCFFHFSSNLSLVNMTSISHKRYLSKLTQEQRIVQRDFVLFILPRFTSIYPHET